MTSDPRILTKQELLGILGTSAPSGDTQINSVRTAISSCRQLHVDGDMSITGTVLTPLSLGQYLTTSGGDLVLNPVGANINLSGKNLINVGGVVTNPNRYEVAMPISITTLNGTPTPIMYIPTIIGSAYTLSIDVACADMTDGASTASLTIGAKAKNIGGVITIVPNIALTHAIDGPLAGIVVALASDATNVILMATGTGSTIKWYAAATVTRQLF